MHHFERTFSLKIKGLHLCSESKAAHLVMSRALIMLMHISYLTTDPFSQSFHALTFFKP